MTITIITIKKTPDPWEEKTLLPTKYIIERSKDDISEMVYTIEDGFIKEAREFKTYRQSERKSNI